MNTKRLILIIGAVIVGLAIIVGVILYLRNRDFPGIGSLRPSSPGASQNGESPKIDPFTPISETPKAPDWNPADPPPPITVDGPDSPTLGGPPQE